MTYSNLPRMLLLTVALVGLVSVASACEISGYKFQCVKNSSKHFIGSDTNVL